MTVITISREFGSEGTTIARQTAQALGFTLVDKKILEKVLTQFGYIRFGKAYDSIPNFWERLDLDRDNMVSMLSSVVQAMAKFGSLVQIGRGSFAVLGGFSDVLNVRIQAPLPVRIQRVMTRLHIQDKKEAEALVGDRDKVRKAFLQAWYGIQWETVNAFDLVIDTSKIQPETAVKWIVEAQKHLLEQPFSSRPTTLSIKVDPILARTVADVLKELPDQASKSDEEG